MRKIFPQIHLYRIFFLISIFTLLCYSNILTSPWQLDDPPNITENYPLRIDNLQPETLWKTFFAQPFAEGQLYRPITNLSFALNWYLGQDNPLGYHSINLLIHILTVFFLFKATLLLLQAPFLKKYTESDVFFIALLSATLWAINPVQTQAVTYIVQRMASMAAMFYIFAVYNYIRARRVQARAQIITRSILCALFFLLAMGCKENAITLIPSLLLLETLFFYKKNDRFSKIALTALIVTNVCLFLAALYYALDHNLLQSLSTPVGSRPFSIGERLLTQPSILLFYLSLLLYPSPARLSIDHSFPLSTSLLHPWTTLPAMLCIMALLFLAAWQWRKRPLLSFAILFFFINHLVESTIIPLELIFEHRNYLPSFFLFLPLAAGLRFTLNSCASSSRLLYLTIVVSTTILLIAIGLGTYLRNSVWATEELLWADTLSKASDNARPFAKLGAIYGWQKDKTPENLQTAIALLQKSLERESPRTSFKPAIVDNIGKVYANYGMLDQAIIYYKKSLQLNPDFITSRFDLANALTLQGNFQEALEQIDIVIAKNDLQSRFFNLKTMLLLWLDRPKEAAECSHQTMRRTLLNKERYFYNTGVALSKAGHHSQGEWFLNRALQQFPDDIRILYSLIENRILAGSSSDATKYALQLLDKQGIISLTNNIERLRTDYSAVPVNVDLIAPIIIKAAQDAVIKLSQMPSK
ncbi:MAG: tetratricopeptide repeat protein [Desulfocapsaceae bacterium]|nr:tetratricopeptide repeat protein [Desulfocapsaceae bacterium]